MVPILENVYAEPDYRAERLADTAIAWFSAVAGPQNRDLNRTLLQLHRDSAMLFRQPVRGAIHDHLLNVFRWISANKCDAVGAAPLRRLIDLGLEQVPAQGLDSDFGKVSYISFLFMLGSGLAADPVHGWVGRALEIPDAGDARAERLHAMAMATLGDFLAHR